MDREWRTPYNQTAASFYLDSQLAASRSMAFNMSKKLYSTLTPTRVEASTAFSMGSVPDPFFPPQYKRKKVIWLRETTLDVVESLLSCNTVS